MLLTAERLLNNRIVSRTAKHNHKGNGLEFFSGVNQKTRNIDMEAKEKEIRRERKTR